ncbi:response regulator [Hymenobacter armeniacus]|uniref:Response regulator n=1 Tax=Hymenobacter armeniacus TaxID=2771358 RepID=A0ABR8JUM8_9BACT|nr:response regulator [Hymenobacter armeniacus]MBD2723042.1 response regulator [Hymenobacter armeniacus]
MHTLLIDDDLIGVFLTERLLRREAFSDDIVTLSTAHEALTFLQQAAPDELPRVVFLDLNMPMMNGWELLAALQPIADRLRGRCRFYILTSSLAQADTARVDEFALVAGLLRKPIDSEQIRLVRTQLEQAATG